MSRECFLLDIFDSFVLQKKKDSCNSYCVQDCCVMLCTDFMEDNAKITSHQHPCHLVPRLGFTFKSQFGSTSEEALDGHTQTPVAFQCTKKKVTFNCLH